MQAELTGCIGMWVQGSLQTWECMSSWSTEMKSLPTLRVLAVYKLQRRYTSNGCTRPGHQQIDIRCRTEGRSASAASYHVMHCFRGTVWCMRTLSQECKMQ